MERTPAVLVSVGVALVAGGVGYAVSSGPLIALALTEVYGVGAWLTVTYYDALPDSGDWDVAKWNGALVAVLTSAVFGTMNAIGVSLDTGFALALLVYGVSVVGYFVAIAQFTAVATRDTDSGNSTAGTAA